MTHIWYLNQINFQFYLFLSISTSSPPNNSVRHLKTVFFQNIECLKNKANEKNMFEIKIYVLYYFDLFRTHVWYTNEKITQLNTYALSKMTISMKMHYQNLVNSL